MGMQLFDIKARVGEDGNIEHQFFKKPMASSMCILEISAQSKKVKKTTLIPEGLRRLRNCSLQTGWKDKAQILTEWSETMARSGYKTVYIKQVIKVSVGLYKDMVRKDSEGERPMWRPNSWMKEERLEQKEREKDGHCPRYSPRLDGKKVYQSQLILDPISGGNMEREMVELCKCFSFNNNMTVTLMGRGGAKLSQAVKAEPVGSLGCNRHLCESCKEGGGGGNCQICG